jgi:hypothetical protein
MPLRQSCPARPDRGGRSSFLSALCRDNAAVATASLGRGPRHTSRRPSFGRTNRLPPGYEETGDASWYWPSLYTGEKVERADRTRHYDHEPRWTRRSHSRRCPSANTGAGLESLGDGSSVESAAHRNRRGTVQGRPAHHRSNQWRPAKLLVCGRSRCASGKACHVVSIPRWYTNADRQAGARAGLTTDPAGAHRRRPKAQGEPRPTPASVTVVAASDSAAGHLWRAAPVDTPAPCRTRPSATMISMPRPRAAPDADSSARRPRAPPAPNVTGHGDCQHKRRPLTPPSHASQRGTGRRRPLEWWRLALPVARCARPPH